MLSFASALPDRASTDKISLWLELFNSSLSDYSNTRVLFAIIHGVYIKQNPVFIHSTAESRVSNPRIRIRIVRLSVSYRSHAATPKQC